MSQQVVYVLSFGIRDIDAGGAEDAYWDTMLDQMIVTRIAGVFESQEAITQAMEQLIAGQFRRGVVLRPTVTAYRLNELQAGPWLEAQE